MGLEVRSSFRIASLAPIFPVIFVLGTYLIAAEMNALEHPGSRVFPTFAQIVDGLNYSTAPDAINGRIRILDDTAASIFRLVAGLAVSSVFAITLSLIFFSSGAVKEVLYPLFLLSAKIPMIAALPLVLIWVGVGEPARIFLIFLGIVPILTVQCFDFLETSYNTHGMMLERKNIPLSHQIYFVWLPQLFPAFLRFIQSNLGLAWLYLFIAETFGAASGLGYRIAILRTRVWMDVTLVYLVWIGIISLFLYYSLSRLVRRLEGPPHE